eukprot:TRINITY_DN1449_c0_g1_i1.p1 TRINITY_DN1449_c0_g1~~TRINITY_DN1449_c0_g1_i1.p1  ORF type:complete len:202 (-),score=61.18 TRINITY_DN1449_c0_g1_i1:127-732(-)
MVACAAADGDGSRCSRCGAVLIDADKLGHESYELGQPCYKKLVEEFGEGIVAPDGTINRKALGSIVFSDPDQRRRLEGIVWPAIQTMAEERIRQFKQGGTPCVALEAAVMLEANWRGLVDELWVVSTPEEMAVERMAARNGLTREQALSRIHVQASNAEREAQADVVIHTVGTLEELEEKVLQHWRERPTTITRRRGIISI